jgi:hypothetical protein
MHALEHAILRRRTQGTLAETLKQSVCDGSLRLALYHWSRVAIQHDAASRSRYAQLRERGHSHPRALRSVADRLLNVACAMLRYGMLFNPEAAGKLPSTA